MSTLSCAEPCAACYLAQRVAGHIVIFAMGVHFASGCVIFFRREPGDVFPPRFCLWHLCSDSPQLHFLTPFSACTSFQTTRRVDRIEILDAHGCRTIAVDDLPESPPLLNLPGWPSAVGVGITTMGLGVCKDRLNATPSASQQVFGNHRWDVLLQ